MERTSGMILMNTPPAPHQSPSQLRYEQVLARHQARRARREAEMRTLDDAGQSCQEKRMNHQRMKWPVEYFERGIVFPYPVRDSIELVRERVWPYIMTTEQNVTV